MIFAQFALCSLIFLGFFVTITDSCLCIGAETRSGTEAAMPSPKTDVIHPVRQPTTGATFHDTTGNWIVTIVVCKPVASLGLVSPGATTDGVTYFFLKKLADPFFLSHHPPLQSDDLF